MDIVITEEMGAKVTVFKLILSKIMYLKIKIKEILYVNVLRYTVDGT